MLSDKIRIIVIPKKRRHVSQKTYFKGDKGLAVMLHRQTCKRNTMSKRLVGVRYIDAKVVHFAVDLRATRSGFCIPAHTDPHSGSTAEGC